MARMSFKLLGATIVGLTMLTITYGNAPRSFQSIPVQTFNNRKLAIYFAVNYKIPPRGRMVLTKPTRHTKVAL